MMRKRTGSVFLVLVVLAGILLSMGCQKKEQKEDKTQRYAWPLATCSTDDTITHIFATAFAEEVGRLSDGKMKIQVYPQSTLGGDRELMESCKDGDIPFVAQSPAPQVSFMPELCVFDTPCVYNRIEDVRKAIDKEDFQKIIKKIYQDAGYQLLGTADQCFRIMTSKKPFDGIESFKGQKIRTMEDPYQLKFWKEIKANPTPMSFSEVYIGLQQGTIDAQENAYEIIVSAKLYEQQNYVIETNAVPDLVTLISSDKFYQTLTKRQQEIIQKAAKTAQETARDSADSRAEERKEVLRAEGMEFVEIDEDTWARMQKASAPVYEMIRKTAGDELVDLYTGE